MIWLCTKKICTIHKLLIKRYIMTVNSRNHNPRVGGSNPSFATIKKTTLKKVVFYIAHRGSVLILLPLPPDETVANSRYFHNNVRPIKLSAIPTLFSQRNLILGTGFFSIFRFSCEKQLPSNKKQYYPY